SFRFSQTKRYPNVPIFQTALIRCGLLKLKRTRLPRVNSGQELLAILSGTDDLVFKHDEFQEAIAAELLSSFAGAVDDFGDVTSWGTLKDAVETEVYFSEQIGELESNGMYVYAGRTKGKLKTRLGVIDEWIRSIVIVSKHDVKAVFWSHAPEV
ncbi:MAG: hypothetical protein JXA10_13990, partial [Anaerolineae bacterium]|nr:hypothetical protein [Anaerolineae bacterium]